MENNNNENNAEVKNEKHSKKEKKHDNAAIEQLQNEKNALNDKLLRLAAEMQNMKKRYEDEITKIYKYDGEEIVKKILPIIDNFERAIKLDDKNLTDELSKFLEGFKMIYGNLVSILNDLDVKEIVCLNTPFDPNTMEAVLTQHEDGVDAGIVLDVMQKGYMYKDKVIRHSMVKVSE